MQYEVLFKILAYVVPIVSGAVVVLIRLGLKWIAAERYRTQRDCYKNLLEEWFKNKK